MEKPAFQIKSAGKGFWHIVDSATDKVVGFRRSWADAEAYAKRLSTLKRNDLGAEG